jgi:hypothetical protein
MMPYAYTQLCTSTHRRWPESYDRKSTDEARAEPNYVSNQRDYNHNPESPMNPNSNLEIQLKCNQATMAIDNRYDDEVVDGAMNFQRGK